MVNKITSNPLNDHVWQWVVQYIGLLLYRSKIQYNTKRGQCIGLLLYRSKIQYNTKRGQCIGPGNNEWNLQKLLQCVVWLVYLL